jgi:hypothetical protein
VAQTAPPPSPVDVPPSPAVPPQNPVVVQPVAFGLLLQHTFVPPSPIVGQHQPPEQ